MHSDTPKTKSPDYLFHNPHSYCFHSNTFVQLGQEICKTPEQFKVWSQNLGHEKVLTTFLSYGEVACQRQGEIIHDLATPQKKIQTDADEIADAILKRPQVFFFHSETALLRPTSVFPGVDQDPGLTFAVHLIAGICALLLVGYLFWSFCLKFKKEIQADLSAMEGSLYNLSLTTGRTEYELFCKSGEEWSVSGERIDADFGRYMADQVLPYYARDFVRKNRENTDETLIKKVDVEPTSWWDWAKV